MADKVKEATPGPYHYQQQADAYTHIVRGPKDEYIAGCGQGYDGECEATARLLAASWEMLQALEACISQIESLCSADDVPDGAREALSKARGEER